MRASMVSRCLCLVFATVVGLGCGDSSKSSDAGTNGLGGSRAGSGAGGSGNAGSGGGGNGGTTSPTGNGDAAVGNGGASAQNGGDAAVNDGGGGAGTGSDDELPPYDLFGDPDVPSCDQGAVAGARAAGTLDGQAVAWDFGVSSQMGNGEFYYVQSAGGQLGEYPLDLRWDGPLELGVGTRVYGSKIWVPDDQPGGGRFYCILRGWFGPVPEDEQPTEPNRGLFKFRIDRAYANEDCSGGPVDIDIKGCIYRTEGSLGTTAPTNDFPPDAPMCSPLSRRVTDRLSSVVQEHCVDQPLDGLPNPTHPGYDVSLELLEPLEPGYTYALNVEALDQADTVEVELWGQRELCGAVDELLWTGHGEYRRQCIEFVPTMAHTHLLRVSRQLGPYSVDAFDGELILCRDGSCGDATDGQGLAPGQTLTVEPGAYEAADRASVDSRGVLRLGDDGLLMSYTTDNGFSGPDTIVAAFRMPPFDPFGDAWYCSPSGTRGAIEGTSGEEINLTAITKLPPQPAGSGTATIALRSADCDVTDTIGIPEGTALYARVNCSFFACDVAIRHDTGNSVLMLRLDADIGTSSTSVDTQASIIDGAWVWSAKDTTDLTLVTELQGTVARSGDTITVSLQALGALRPCTGNAASPDTAHIVLD